MSCGSCGAPTGQSCGCNPCTQVQSQESVASILNNLVTTLLGGFTKTVVNGRATWTSVCDPNELGLACFPRMADEGLVCYLLRILDLIGIFSGGLHNSALPYCKNTMVASTNALYVAIQDVPAGTLITNTSYWQFLVEAPAGPAGPQGPAGSPGAGGSPNYAILVTPSDVTVGDTDAVVICDNAIPMAVTLPAISGTLSGKWYTVKRGVTSSADVTITPDGSDTIDGAGSYVLTAAQESITLVSDNVGDWRII